MGRIEATALTSVEQIKYDQYEGFSNKVYRFVVEIPLDFIQRREPGPLMAFNVSEKNFYEVLLAAKRAYTNFVAGGKANITVEVAEAYVSLAFRDLKKVKGAYVITQDSDEEQTVSNPQE